VVTNPPYMGSGGMPVKLVNFIKKMYPNSKADVYSTFIEKGIELCLINGFVGLITPQSIMFLGSFLYHRKLVVDNYRLSSMAYLGFGAFGADYGTTSFVIAKSKMSNYNSTFVSMESTRELNSKERLYLSGDFRYNVKVSSFKHIPGVPIAFWIKSYHVFDNKNLEEKYCSGGRIKTHNNEKFVRSWWEVDINKPWGPYCNGGSFRKWYGNYYDVVDWSKKARDEYDSHGGMIRDEFLEREGITWNDFTSQIPSFRVKTRESLYSSVSPTIFTKNCKFDYAVLGLLNSSVGLWISRITNPTVHTLVGDVLHFPDLTEKCNECIIDTVKDCINIAKTEWDCYEISKDFIRHPMVCENISKISEAYDNWNVKTQSMFSRLKANEEFLNKEFIRIYELEGEVLWQADDKYIGVRKADAFMDIKSFISYAVGCMFGRYSLDVEGLAYAGGDWNEACGVQEGDKKVAAHDWQYGGKYKTFAVDPDNIIPICDDEYFDDDIAGRFVEFVKTVYGVETLEENLKFIADTLGGKGSPREIIRTYFSNSFYADHCKTYQKRPIYWLFDSGKKNGFKCLIYMHRYAKDTIARIRTDYVHEQQARYRTAIEGLESRIATAGTSERVKLNKQLATFQAKAEELHDYEEKIHHYADAMIDIDLDDGVKANYAKFADVLAKIK